MGEILGQAVAVVVGGSLYVGWVAAATAFKAIGRIGQIKRIRRIKTLGMARATRPR